MGGNVHWAVAAPEDKMVQQAVTILNQIYEEDFLSFSYGFRPGKKMNYILDASDIPSGISLDRIPCAEICGAGGRQQGVGARMQL
jgi:hypothetical protein